MEAISGALGMIAAIPQCIEAAKQFYDLRVRFAQASVLITAIYTESMVVAASLSQIQKLLQSTALQDKPELCKTLDKALTGCWLVYQCLDEEVQELAQKLADDELRKRDRASFLLKESNFKELLQQIRGQQSALGLLVQGLQMESLSDMHRLIGDNSVKLDQIAKRSNTLRQKHPNVKVPESILDGSSVHDTQSIFGDAEFAFDDEVVNSKAYRRAMARATSRGLTEQDNNDIGIVEGDLIDLRSLPDEVYGEPQLPTSLQADMRSLILEEVDDAIGKNDGSSYVQEEETSGTDVFDDLERSMLPFMPPASSTSQISMAVTAIGSVPRPSPPESSATTNASKTSTLVGSLGEETNKLQNSIETRDVVEAEEAPPPLPPRRPPHSLSPDNSTNSRELKKASSWEDIFSPLSTTSSLSLTDPSAVTTNQDASIDIDGKSTSIWTSILSEEETFVMRLNNFRTIFYEGIIKEWPVLKRHLEALALMGTLATLHQEYILEKLEDRLSRHPPTTGDSQLFITWASKTYKVLKEYSQRYPHALYALRITRSREKTFGPYVDTLGFGAKNIGTTWEDYLLLPIVQLKNYIQGLRELLRCKQESITAKEQKREQEAIELLQRLDTQCSDLRDQAFRQEDLQTLHRRLHTADTNLVEMLQLSAPERRILHQGPTALKPNGSGPWRSLHVILLDSHFLWGKAGNPVTWKQKDRKGDSIWIVDQPIPVSQLTVRLPVNKEQAHKTSYLDELPRGTALYELFIDVVKSPSKSTTHVLGLISTNDRETWYQRFSEVAAAKPTEPSA